MQNEWGFDLFGYNISHGKKEIKYARSVKNGEIVTLSVDRIIGTMSISINDEN